MPSFCTRMKRVCSERLCRMEFCRDSKDREDSQQWLQHPRQEGHAHRAVSYTGRHGGPGLHLPGQLSEPEGSWLEGLSWRVSPTALLGISPQELTGHDGTLLHLPATIRVRGSLAPGDLHQPCTSPGQVSRARVGAEGKGFSSLPAPATHAPSRAYQDAPSTALPTHTSTEVPAHSPHCLAPHQLHGQKDPVCPCTTRHQPSGAASRPPSLPGIVWHHREAEAGREALVPGCLQAGCGGRDRRQVPCPRGTGGFTNPATATTAQTRAGWGLLSPRTLLAPCIHIQHPTGAFSLKKELLLLLAAAALSSLLKQGCPGRRQEETWSLSLGSYPNVTPTARWGDRLA